MSTDIWRGAQDGSDSHRYSATPIRFSAKDRYSDAPVTHLDTRQLRVSTADLVT